jgi:colicin import membrane protein
MSAVMSAAVLDSDPVNAPAAVLSVVVHLALFTFLFFGIRWQSKLPDAVVVELWDRPAVEQQAEAPKAEPKPEPTPEPKIEPKVEPRVEPRVEPKAEVKPVKPDIAVEKEKKPQPKKEPKKVEPTVTKFDRAKAIQSEVERDLRQVSPASRPAPPPAGTVVDAGYAKKIQAKIRSNVVLPVGIVGNPEAIFDVVQLPTGEVLEPVRLRKSSGNRAYDEAVERAILKSSPLPKPDRPEQFVRELQLKFRPVE